jgi:hypothetical protein
MESEYYSEESPAQTLAEARSTSARLAGVLSALLLRSAAIALVTMVLATLTGIILFSLVTSRNDFDFGIPVSVMPSLVLLGLYVTYKALETYLDLIAVRRSLSALQVMYEREILDASISMPREGL